MNLSGTAVGRHRCHPRRVVAIPPPFVTLLHTNLPLENIPLGGRVLRSKYAVTP
jgi:hypothetical protein